MPRSSTRPIAGPSDTRTIPTKIRRPSTARHPEHRPYVTAAHAMIARGQRPAVHVVVIGFNGIFVRLIVEGLPGPIAHARTRRRAREMARARVASILQLDPYAFDLQVDGA